MQWKSIRLHPSFKVNVQNKTKQSSLSLNAQIEIIWNKKKQQYPYLFNGCVFTVNKLNSYYLTGHWTEFKLILAQMKRPELYKSLLLRPLAVNGLIQCADGFILGQRNKNSVYLPQYWQSPPAGSVESRQKEKTVDLMQQLYAEAKEELGLDQKHFTKTYIISATEHSDTHILDIGILLYTYLPFSEIKQIWQSNANNEYSQLICLSPSDAPPHLLLPTTQFLIKSWNKYFK